MLFGGLKTSTIMMAFPFSINAPPSYNTLGNTLFLNILGNVNEKHSIDGKDVFF